jgi:hypothetical protein
MRGRESSVRFDGFLRFRRWQRNNVWAERSGRRMLRREVPALVGVGNETVDRPQAEAIIEFRGLTRRVTTFRR